MVRRLFALVAALGVITASVVGAYRWSNAPDKVPTAYRQTVLDAAKRCPQVPVRVLAAQMATESSWRPTARSGKGAQGIAQFMPRTWSTYGIDADGDGRADIWDPQDAIHSAARFNCLMLRQVRGLPGDPLANTLAAYNAGIGAVRQYRGIPPYQETQDYVRKILSRSQTIQVTPVG